MQTWKLAVGAAAIAVGCGGTVTDAPSGPTAQALSTSGVQVSGAVHSDVSPPLREMPPIPPAHGGAMDRPIRLTGAHSPGGPDTALQLSPGPAIGTTSGMNIAGIGAGDYGFTPNAAPPDTNGAVGATQYVQWVNESFAVFDKATGALLLGPTAGNTLWQGFGGGCETNNDGDPIVQYDEIANRWILTQFSVSTTPYLQCVAVSTTSDATGTYNRYAFSYGNTEFPDYPKLGVWPDAYYVTFNIFDNGSTFAGAKLCAYDRTAMLSGAPATQQCFQLGTSYGGVLPADLDGTTPPPTGAPETFLDFGSNSLNAWQFHVDFANPAATTLTGPTSLGVSPFTEACNGGSCIAQPGTSNKLDSLGDRLMYRLAYRQFSGYGSMVVNHSIKISGNRHSQSVGVRWYELRASGTTLAVYQQGTYSPDSDSRWMGSVAMDKVGDIAVGYSVSSGATFPSIRYTDRAPTDPLGNLGAENPIVAGGGAQTGSLHRWGDYSALSVDPVDGCTFYYTTEYLKSSGSFNWSTRIASFKFPGCQ